MAASGTPAVLHLLSLHPSTSVSRFLSLVRSSANSSTPFDPISVSHAHHIIHRPRSVSREPLLSNRFDLVVILPTSGTPETKQELQAFPDTDALRALVSAHMVFPLTLPEHSISFLNPKQRNSFLAPTYELPKEWLDGTVLPPPATVATNETVEQASATCTLLSPSLANWLRDFGALKQGQGAVSILTLASLNPGDSEKIEAFQNEVSQRLGYPRGERSTTFPVTGPESYESAQTRVMGSDGAEKSSTEQWHVAEVARWPDIWYWAEMISSQDYRDTEDKHGLSDGVMRDKCILCLTEVQTTQL